MEISINQEPLDETVYHLLLCFAVGKRNLCFIKFFRILLFYYSMPREHSDANFHLFFVTSEKEILRLPDSLLLLSN